jgi:hypothetical protein
MSVHDERPRSVFGQDSAAIRTRPQKGGVPRSGSLLWFGRERLIGSRSDDRFHVGVRVIRHDV